jgi:hypothetical protein
VAKNTEIRSRKKSARKAGRRKNPSFPEKQWAMPAGFRADDSEVASLRDVVDPTVPTKQLSDLTLEQRAELVAKRLALQPSIELAMVGAGMIDKERAITEVKNKTKIGKLLIEIEHQMIRNLMEQAQKKYAKAPRPRRSKVKPNR